MSGRNRAFGHKNYPVYSRISCLSLAHLEERLLDSKYTGTLWYNLSVLLHLTEQLNDVFPSSRTESLTSGLSSSELTHYTLKPNYRRLTNKRFTGSTCLGSRNAVSSRQESRIITQEVQDS